MGAAIRSGIDYALAHQHPRFDALAFMDGDLTHDPEDLPRLVEPIASGDADLVLGSRYVRGGRMVGVPLRRRQISIVGNWFARLLLGVTSRDLTTGYRVGRREVFESVPSTEAGFGIQLESTVKTARVGFRLTEVPIILQVRKHGYSKMVYNRHFWLGYGGMLLKLGLDRGVPRQN
jgi:dolichol-phosphate mannosyltransferase